MSHLGLLKELNITVKNLFSSFMNFDTFINRNFKIMKYCFSFSDHSQIKHETLVVLQLAPFAT